MGFSPEFDAHPNDGFIILDRFNQPWARTLFKTKSQALQALQMSHWNNDDLRHFKIVPAKFDWDKGEICSISSTDEMELSDHSPNSKSE
jgi:hypothetical protein